jgi:hypothetical protein
LNQLEGVHEILLAGHVIEGDINAIKFILIPLIILKWWSFRLLRWMQNLHQSSVLNSGLSLVTIVGLHMNMLLLNNDASQSSGTW